MDLFNLVYLWLHRLLSKRLFPVLSLTLLQASYILKFTLHLPKIHIWSCSLFALKKEKKTEDKSKFLSVTCEPSHSVSDLAPHSLLPPLLRAYAALWLQRTPYHFPILKDPVPCSLFLCMKCSLRPTQWGTAQTFPFLWNYHLSSLLYLALFQPNDSFLNIHIENTKWRKNC